MFSYSCPSCNQRLLAPPEKVGSRTICPKCLKPLTIPSVDREAAVDLEQVLEPIGATAGEVSLSGSVQVAVGQVANRALTVDSSSVASYEIDLENLAATVVDTTPELRDPPATPSPVKYAEPANVSSNTKPTSVSTITPPPMPKLAGDFRTRKMSSAKDLAGMINLTPTGLFAVDAVAELSAAISMRMKPPPEPSSDHLIIKASWILATAVSTLVWFASVLIQPHWFVCVALLGTAMITFGFCWRAYLVGRHGQPILGLITLLPPMNVIKMFKRSGEYGLKPLKFVLTGLAVVGLYFAGPFARDASQSGLRAIGLVSSNK